MSYKIGYIANRVGVPSLSKQTELLIEHGVSDESIFDNLDDCLGSLRENDTLVVYTTAIFGRNKINDVFKFMSNDIKGFVYSVKSEHQYDCTDGQEGIDTLHTAWLELESITKSHMAKVGAEKGGRKRGKAWKHEDEIKQSFAESVPKKELAELYETSEATITRILNK